MFPAYVVGVLAEVCHLGVLEEVARGLVGGGCGAECSIGDPYGVG